MNTLGPAEIRKLISELTGDEIVSKKFLLIILGLLGDFDSFEQIQSLMPMNKKLIDSNIDLRIIGIGSKDSKAIFCKYTQLTQDNLIIVENTKIHDALGLYSCSEITSNSYFNLLLMCLGINSPGTIKEVLRGYLGDRGSKRIFDSENESYFKSVSIVNPDLFQLLDFVSGLRPFELASLRLSNLFQVMTNWNLYMLNGDYLTQRGGTFLLDGSDIVLYSHKSKGLLNYSNKMSDPYYFLEKYLTN